MRRKIIECGICGKTELSANFDGKIDSMGIYMDPRKSKDVKIARKFGLTKKDLRKLRAIHYYGYCRDCLKRERQIAIEKGKVYCGRPDHGYHYTWSDQFWDCLAKKNLIFSEMELYHMGLI